MANLREGDRIHNYLLEAKVGAGSFGEVWRARHHVFGELVAIKIPTDTQYVRSLQREGVTIHGLRHPNIVRAVDLDPYADPPYLIMEYVDGPSLRTAIDTYKSKFPIDAAVAVIRGVLQALSAAHAQDVIHRDVKPPNILLHHPLDRLDSIGEQAVRVTDFGLGRVGGETMRMMMQSMSLASKDGKEISGTIAYMSPEQREGLEVDARTDLYACGIVLFEMLTGERPQGGELPSLLRPDVPRPLDDVFQRAYARYERRYASAAEMLAALANVPSAMRPVPPLPPRAVPLRPLPSAYAGRGTRCPSCTGLVQDDDQFCIHCGAQLVPAVPQCPSCQAYVHRSDRFCIFCGADLRVLTT